ncbi:unnamed protein product [Penicillium salamii]|nr:unnamed protein product [Penicillium salamii]
MQHTIEPTKEVDNKVLDQRYSGKDGLAAYETPLKSIATTYGQLQRWLISACNVLIKSDGLHTAILADIELQTRYILFIIGQYISPHSSFLAESFQSEHSLYRPFGVRASIALICFVFEGIWVDEMEGYESKEIWICDENFLIMMVSWLKESLLFGPEVSMFYL